MNGVDVIRTAFREVHEAIEGDVETLQPGELFYQPAPDANHVGFLLRHLIRDEDAVVSDVTGQPGLWSSGRWFERMNMEERGQGTGFDSESLGTFRYDLHDLMAYAREVWEATDSRLAPLSEDDLDGPAPGAPGKSVVSLLTTGSIAHDWVHLGEIRYVRGLQGWRFQE